MAKRDQRDASKAVHSIGVWLLAIVSTVAGVSIAYKGTVVGNFLLSTGGFILMGLGVGFISRTLFSKTKVAQHYKRR
jgi:NhaP-type Na+/H+ or K+/H+ antiporter